MTFTESTNNTGERQECFIQKKIGLHSDLKYIGTQELELSIVLKWKAGINAYREKVVNEIKVTGQSL
jgi:hypothetical protein